MSFLVAFSNKDIASILNQLGILNLPRLENKPTLIMLERLSTLDKTFMLIRKNLGRRMMKSEMTGGKILIDVLRRILYIYMVKHDSRQRGVL